MIARPVLYGGALLIGGLTLYTLAKMKPGESLAGAAGRAAAGAVGDVATGAVKGLGAVFGIPETSADQCTRDLDAGRTWDASFSCPASRFIGGVFNSTKISAASRTDADRVDAEIMRQQIGVAASGGEYDQMGNFIGPYGGNTGGATGSW